MSPQFVLATGVRWVGFVALATLVGGLVVELLVLPQATPVVDGARQRLRHLGLLCLVVLVGATAGDLMTRAQTMAGGGWPAAIAAVPAVLAHTHFGAVWIARFALLAVALVLAAGSLRALRAGTFALALAIALTTTVTGHAADWGDLTLSAGIDWVHVVATTAWAGGLIALAVAVLREAREWPLGVLAGCMRRFSRLAGFCVAAVLATGLWSAWVQLQGPSALVTTSYGRVLAVKLLLVSVLLWLGALNRYTVVPALDSGRPADPGFRLARWVFRESSRARHAAPSRLGTFVAREAVLAVVVFACTAVLADSTPPRHVQHGEHRAETPESQEPPIALGSRRHGGDHDSPVTGTHPEALRKALLVTKLGASSEMEGITRDGAAAFRSDVDRTSSIISVCCRPSGHRCSVGPALALDASVRAAKPIDWDLDT